MKITVGIVDDHQLFLKSLTLMLETLQDFEVLVEALNGKELQVKMKATGRVPDIMLVDVNMPYMNGVATCRWLHQHHPAVKLVALSMNDNEAAVVEMFAEGCCAYLLKDVHPAVLAKALRQVYTQGYAPSDAAKINPARLLGRQQQHEALRLTPKEQQFLALACSDLTYKQIASDMHIAERTVDGYREALFQRFGVQSRVGLCLEALRTGVISLPETALGSNR